MKTIDQKRIEEIKSRLKNATPGPWKSSFSRNDYIQSGKAAFIDEITIGDRKIMLGNYQEHKIGDVEKTLLEPHWRNIYRWKLKNPIEPKPVLGGDATFLENVKSDLEYLLSLVEDNG